MWRIIIVAALLGAVTGYKISTSSSYVKPLEDDDIADPTTTNIVEGSAFSTTLQALTTDAAAPLTSSTTIKSTEPPIKDEPTSMPEIGASEVPILLPISPNPQGGDDITSNFKRRLVTYDQRQEGQYNIRADLENFMIMFLPAIKVQDFNLLDLLGKSSSLGHSAQSSSSKGRRKNNISASLPGLLPQTAANRFRQAISASNNNQNFNYVTNEAKRNIAVEQQQQQQQQQLSHQPLHQHHLSIAEGPGPSPARFQEFIEGRTPYHVDISSSDGEQSRLQPDRQVDVIPPPYPLSYPQLIKPFHLEAEPTVIQALPPSGLSPNTHGANNFLETYNQLFAARLLDDKHAAAASSSQSGAVDSNYYRVSRAIPTSKLNNISESNNMFDADVDLHKLNLALTLGLLPVTLAEQLAKMYPPIAPHIATLIGIDYYPKAQTSSLRSDEDNDLNDSMLDEIVVPAQSLPVDDLDLDLNSASYIKSGAKSLLDDGGLERCAPGRHLDSYGVCREIEGY